MKLRFTILLLCLFTLTGCDFFSKEVRTGLQVMTSDIESSIFINGQFIEKTPLIDKSLPPGQYALQIVPDDNTYVPYETTVVLREGLLTVLTWSPGKTLETTGGVIYEMEPLKDKQQTEINFTSEPAGVILTLDNGAKEFSPKVFTDVAPGNHSFEATLPSYITQNHTLQVVPGYRMNVKIKLAKSAYREPDLQQTLNTEDLIATASAATQSAIASPSAIIDKGVKILSTDYYINQEEVLKVRQSPSATSPEIGTVAVGNIYALLAERDEWYQINTTTIRGWISKKYGEIVEKQ